MNVEVLDEALFDIADGVAFTKLTSDTTEKSRVVIHF